MARVSDEDREQTMKLMEILNDVYKPEGVALWLAHANRHGWSYEEKLQCAFNASEGNFS